jgi:hypothetical protein
MGLLFRLYFYLNGRNTLISIAAATGIVFVVNAFIFSINYSYSSNQFDQFFSMIFLFALGGAAILWTGQAFPQFRSKISTQSYLLIPASHLEKLVVEMVIRIILLLIIFPLLYWVGTNFATLFMSIFPHYDFFSFSFELPVESLPIRDYALFISLGMMVPVIVFTGAAYFRKLPSVKTIAAVFLLFCVFLAFIYFGKEILELQNYYKENRRLLFIDKENAKVVSIVTAWVVNAYLIVMGYFKLKEKEA